MAAKPTLVASPLTLWDRFRHLAKSRVRECNAIACEPLWSATETPGPLPKLTVESTARSAERVEFSFDLDSRILACKPGPAIKAAPLAFEWLEGGVDALRREGREFTVDEALNFALDELVCTEEW